MNRDPFYTMIMDRLAGTLDGELFEHCAADLLRDSFPGLAPIRGGDDGGMDAAIPDGEGEAYPLITTTSNDVIGNLRRNLQSYLDRGHGRRKAVLATSQSLTPRKRSNLEAAARELGFVLVQVHDRTSFADLLYRNSAWCRELLGLGGDPCPLSIVPASTRPVLNLSLLGRDEDILWLKNTEGDRLLVGQPGSGKTFLLRQLAREELGLFLISRDRREIAAGVRDQDPRLVFVDDALPGDQLLADLAQLRSATRAEFDIVATCWPNHKRDVLEVMRLPTEKVRELERLTRDQIADVAREADPTLPPWLIQEIVVQAEGLPGLAATLAYLASHGDVRAVAFGDALVQHADQVLRTLVGPEALIVLAILSLSGEIGMALSSIADATDKGQLQLQCMLRDIGAAGIVQQGRDRRIRVRPDRLRCALVRDVFFGPYSLAIDEYIGYSPDAEQLALTLIGSRTAGADVPDELLWNVVRQAGSLQALESYAWLGPMHARRAVGLATLLPASLAKPALRYVPEEAIGMLLQQAIGDDRPLHPHPEAPLRIIDDWVKEARPGTGEPVSRRRLLLDGIAKWSSGGGDQLVATRALRTAFTPSFSGSASEPGSGLQVTLTWGWLMPEEIMQIRRFWPEALDLLLSATALDWRALMGLVDEWLHSSGGSPEPGPEIAEVLAAGGCQMLQDVVSLATSHPAILRWALQEASDLDITLDVTVDPDFITLYPLEDRRAWRQQERELASTARSLGRSWAAADPPEVARRLRWLEDEANLVDRSWPRLTPLACEALASEVKASLPWIAAFLAAELPPDLILPLLARAAAHDEDGWQEQVTATLGHDRYVGVAIQVTLALSAPPLRLLENISARLQGHERMVEVMAMRGEISEQVIAYMLDGDRSVAAAVAWGEWASDPEGTVRESLRGKWRTAIIHYEDDHWLGRIVAVDTSLALCWFTLRLADERFAFWEYKKTLAAIGERLDKDSKLAVLGSVPQRYNVEVVIYYLLRADPLAYGAFLQNDRLKTYHLLPLSGHPQGPWIDNAILALNAGYSAADLVTAAYRGPTRLTSIWWGDESSQWIQWMEMFGQLSGHADLRLREVAVLGAQTAAMKRDRALRKERDEAVYGIR